MAKLSLKDSLATTATRKRAHRVAYHEAGHAVVALALKLRVTSAKIGPVGHSARSARVEVEGLPTWLGEPVDDDEHDKILCLEKIILYAWGGWIAERRYVRLTNGGLMYPFKAAEDARHVEDCHLDMTGSIRFNPIYRQLSHAIVAGCWDAVEAVAAALLRQRKLTREDLLNVTRGLL